MILELSPSRRRDRPQARQLTYLLMVLVFVAVRGFGFGLSPIRRFPDTARFEVLDFLARGYSHFPTIPLLYYFVPSDHFRTVVQFLLAIVCWTILAAVVAASMQSNKLRPYAFATVLLFASSVQIVVWDRNLIAESVGFSLTAVVIASWIALISRPSVGSATAVCATMILFAFVRETFGVLTLMLVPLLLISLLVREGRWHRVAVTVVLAVVSWACLAIVLRNDLKRQFEMDNVIAQRILTDRERLSIFQEAGMPVTPDLLAFAGKWASSDDWALVRQEKFLGFRQWLVRVFPQAYRRYLLLHPGWTLLAPAQDYGSLLSAEPSYCYTGQIRTLPAWLQEIVYPGDASSLLFTALVIVAFATVVFLRFGATRLWIVPVVLLLSTPLHAVIVWHGDAMEVGRHAVALAAILRLALLLLLLLAVDAIAHGHKNSAPVER